MLYEIKVNISEVNEKMNVCSKEIEPTKKKHKQTKQTKEKEEKKEKRKTPERKSKYLKKFTDWVQ